MTPNRIANVVAACLAVVVLWLVAAPAALGGQMRAYTIAGASMQPSLTTGDLVVVRPAPTYEPGDVVAYRSDAVGAVLVHRITAITGDRVTLQGDSNQTPDVDQPRTDELIGRQVARIPAGGRVARALASPLVVLALLGTFLARRRRRRDPQASVPTSTPMLAGILVDRERTRLLLAVLAAGSVGCFGVAGALATGRVSEPQELSFEHHGSFATEAPAPTAVYPDGVARTGDAVFVAVTDTLTISFDYRFSTFHPHAVGGRIALRATISDGQGWSRPMTLVGETPFTGDQARITGSLDLGRIERIRDAIENATGVARGYYRVEVQPAVELEGTIGETSVKDAFLPVFTLDHDGTVIRHVSDPAVDAAHPSRSASVTGEPVETGPEFVLFGRAIPAFVAAFALAVIGALLGAAAVWVRRRARSGANVSPEAVRARFGSRIIPIEQVPATELIPLTDRDAFIRLAARTEEAILERSTEAGTTWIIDRNGRSYIHVEPAEPVMAHDLDEFAGTR